MILSHFFRVNFSKQYFAMTYQITIYTPQSSDLIWPHPFHWFAVAATMAFQHLHITCHLLAFSSLWDDLSRQHRCDWCCCACLHHWLKTVAWFCHVFQHDMCSFSFCCCFWCAKAHSTSNNHHEHPGEGRREGILHKFHQMFRCSQAFYLTHRKS